MEEIIVLVEPPPIVVVALAGNQGIADPPDPYQLAVANGYLGSREQWLASLFSTNEIDPNLPDFVAHWLEAGD